MNILAYDLYPDYNFAREEKIVYTSLDELYHSSDIISLHCPLTEATKYLINDYSISKMKDGVMIINTGRGQLIHTNALIEGLKTRKSDRQDWTSTKKRANTSMKTSPTASSTMMCLPACSRSTMLSSLRIKPFSHVKQWKNIAMTTLQNIKDFINHKPLLNEVKR